MLREPRLIMTCMALGLTLFSQRGLAGPQPGPCTLPLVVRATMVAESEPAWSLAMLYNSGTKHTGTYSIVSGKRSVMAGVELVSIESLSVVLRTRAGLQRCWAEGHAMTGSHEVSVASPMSAKVEARPEVKPRPEVTALMQELTRLRFDDYRGPLEGDIPGIWRENNRGIRRNDFERAGTGFQLVKVRADTLVYQLGLRNFDIVKAINGKAIDDPRRAVELLEAIGRSEKLTVLLQRQGRDMTLDIDY